MSGPIEFPEPPPQRGLDPAATDIQAGQVDAGTEAGSRAAQAATDAAGRGNRRSSWLPVVAVAATCLLVFGVVCWVILPKNEAPTATADQVLAQPQPSFAQAPHAVRKAKPAPTPYTGPPKFTIQLRDAEEDTCPVTFTESIVVPVVKGDLTSLTAVVRVPFDKTSRSRALYSTDGEWSTIIGGLPTKRTVKLLLIGTGSGGRTSIVKDISHPCPGEPMDKPDPYDLGTKAARQKIRKNMFHLDFRMKPIQPPPQLPRSGDQTDATPDTGNHNASAEPSQRSQ